jgi:DNA ligase-1
LKGEVLLSEVYKFPTLYKKTKNDLIQRWNIEVRGNQYHTIEGIVNGKMTESTPIICKGKSIGRSNETSPEEQALREAKAKWQKKVDSGYSDDINKLEDKFFQVMLAKDYHDYIDKLVYPLFVQPKLDGIRCVAQVDGLWSRNGKPFVSVPHIAFNLKRILESSKELVFDGELYTDKFKNDFNSITSLVKKTKPTQKDLELSEAQIQYWVYDFPSPEPFSIRYERLTEIIPDHPSYVLVPTYIVNNKEELDKYYEMFIEQGNEGMIVRYDVPYIHKRTKYLLKRKDFKDDDYKILDIQEGIGNRSGTAGRFILELPDGRTFHSNIKGTFAYLRSLLVEKEEHIGKKATVKYFNLTPDGVPRFPYVIAIRDYE